MTSSHCHKFGFGCRFQGEDLSAIELWEMILSFVKNSGLSRERYTITPGSGSRSRFRDSQVLLSPDEIRNEIALDGSNAFFINSDVSFSPFASYTPTPMDGGTQKLNLVIEAPEEMRPEWSEFAMTLAKYEQMVLGYSFNPLYTGWQNCPDIVPYQKMYGSVSGFPTRELAAVDEHSPPRFRLETSKNPGREARHGLLPQKTEAELWLGSSFWRLAPCQKVDVLAADFFIEVRDTPEFLYLKSWPHPFTRPDGELGRGQQKLWRLLFQEDCEWPPGSGGISDVAVGGPPELMP